MRQRVTMVTAGCGPLLPGCGVELCCPAWRWPESVLSVQSAPAPAPAQQPTTVQCTAEPDPSGVYNTDTNFDI